MRKRPVTRADFVKLGLLVAYAAWVLFQPDDALYPELADVPVPQTSIAAEHASDLTVGLLGLEAPAGTDFMAFGRAMLVPANAGESFDDRFRRLAKGKPKLDAKWPAEMECWLLPTTEAVLATAGSNCAGPEALKLFVDANAELLQRYRQLQKARMVSSDSLDLLADPKPLVILGKTLVILGKLNMADIASDAHFGLFERAWRKWVDDRAFQSEMASLAHGWVLKAILLLNESKNFVALELLLMQAPQLMELHRDELLSLLKPQDPGFYNLIGTMRVAGAILAGEAASRHLPMRPNRLRNRQEDFSRDLIARISVPAANVTETVALVKHAHEVIRAADLLDPIGFVTWRKALDSQTRVFDLIGSMQGMETRRRLFTLRVMLARDRVPDADIDEFLRNMPPELRSPFDGKPFKWIPATRAIAPAIPGTHGMIELKL